MKHQHRSTRSGLERRNLLKLSALGAASFFIHGCKQLGIGQLYKKRKSPNEKINIAVVGSGGMGQADLESVMSENIVALCDSDWANAAESFNMCPNAAKYWDYREMLETRDDIDAVVISTPDHTHAPATALAMRRGFHVRTQKPLTHTVEEARLLAELERTTGVVTQMGNQGTAMDGLRAGAEAIRSGAIGTVKTIHVWTNRPIWPQGMPRPTGSKPIPETLRWDLFLGPAAYRPYNDGYQPFDWRGWWDYGTGALGDMACHIMNLAYYSLELGAPESVECLEQEGNNPESAPTRSTIRYRFPANGKRPALELYWYDGKVMPPLDQIAGLPKDLKLKEGGSIFVGDEGVMYVDDDYGATWRLFPEERFKDWKAPEAFLPRAPRLTDAAGNVRSGWNISAEWLAAIRGEVEATSSGFAAYSGPFTETVLLGNVAMRVGKPLRWDAANLKAKDCPEADAFIKKSYTRGFDVHRIGVA
jgi:predicted dehydrogenase